MFISQNIRDYLRCRQKFICQDVTWSQNAVILDKIYTPIRGKWSVARCAIAFRSMASKTKSNAVHRENVNNNLSHFTTPRLLCLSPALRTIHVNGDLLLWSEVKKNIITTHSHKMWNVSRIYCISHEIDFHCRCILVAFTQGATRHATSLILNFSFWITLQKLSENRASFLAQFPNAFFFIEFAPYAKQYRHYIRFTWQRARNFACDSNTAEHRLRQWKISY